MKIEFRKEDNVPAMLDITFWKTAIGDRRKVNGRELIDTTCQICVDGDTSPVLRELACATARQNPLDKYNRIVGKKVALAKAIAGIAFLKPISMSRRDLTTAECNSMNLKRRLMRQHIWCIFHRTFGRWN